MQHNVPQRQFRTLFGKNTSVAISMKRKTKPEEVKKSLKVCDNSENVETKDASET